MKNLGLLGGLSLLRCSTISNVQLDTSDIHNYKYKYTVFQYMKGRFVNFSGKPSNPQRKEHDSGRNVTVCSILRDRTDFSTRDSSEQNRVARFQPRTKGRFLPLNVFQFAFECQYISPCPQKKKKKVSTFPYTQAYSIHIITLPLSSMPFSLYQLASKPQKAKTKIPLSILEKEKKSITFVHAKSI